MTPLEVIITLAICCIAVIIAQGWHAHRVVTREENRADYYRRLYLDAPRSITDAAERGLERGRSEGYQECLDDIDHDRPALPAETAVMTMARSLRPLFEQAFGPPEWNDPANVPPTIMAQLEPQTIEVKAIEAPGELTVEQERITAAMLDRMDAIRTTALEALR